MVEVNGKKYAVVTGIANLDEIEKEKVSVSAQGDKGVEATNGKTAAKNKKSVWEKVRGGLLKAGSVALKVAIAGGAAIGLLGLIPEAAAAGGILGALATFAVSKTGTIAGIVGNVCEMGKNIWEGICRAVNKEAEPELAGGMA